MTGTPIENRVDDLVNIFAFVDPRAHSAGNAGQAAAGIDRATASCAASRKTW